MSGAVHLRLLASTARPAWLRWVPRLGAYLILLVALALHFALALLDPSHAIEYDPLHDHIVLGGSWLEQARVLAAHRDKIEGPHNRALPAGRALTVRADNQCDANVPRVIAIPSQLDGAGAFLFGVSSQDLLVPIWLPFLEMPLNGGRPFTLTFLPPSEIALPLSDPPPRAF